MANISPRSRAAQNVLRVVVLGVMVSFASTTALSQQTEEITISVPRKVERSEVRPSSSGIRFEEISLSRQVSLAGFDLSKAEDVAEIERRIEEAAIACCKELDILYPLPPVCGDRMDWARKATAKTKDRLRALTRR